MGLFLCKCCCRCLTNNRSSVGVLPVHPLKVLLLGMVGSGKTEVGHNLSNKKRLNFEPTNGTQHYSAELPSGQLSVTEVGGNDEMQKLWHHYFMTAMGIIYCIDMSQPYEELQRSFELFQKTLAHPFVSGKPILVVVTKSDMIDEGVQLYDVENAFQLQALAKEHSSSIRVSFFDDPNMKLNKNNEFIGGISWLQCSMMENYDLLQKRVRIDTNIKHWHEKTQISKQRRKFVHKSRNGTRHKFWKYMRKHRKSRFVRPHTAPAALRVSTITEDISKTNTNTSSDITPKDAIT